MEPCSVVVQANSKEVMEIHNIDDTILPSLKKWPSIRDIVAILPRLKGWQEVEKKLVKSGIKVFVGDTYNVCKRILKAHQLFFNQDFSVRFLLTWKHTDLEYVDIMVEQMRRKNCDLCSPPLDFDITMEADVASLTAIKK